MRVASALLPILLSVAPGAFAQFAGSWSGTYTAVSTECRPSVPHGGSVTINISQNGNAITGTAATEIFLTDCHTANANASAPSSIQTATFTATAADNAFSATFPTGPTTSGSISCTLQNDQLTVTFAIGDTTGIGRATRNGTPAADVSGKWSGTYTAVATYCAPPVSMSGTVTADLTQTGQAVNGLLTIDQPYFDCFPNSRSTTATIDGSVTGRSFSATFDARPTTAWPVGNVRGSLDGETLIVSFVSGDTIGTATLSKPAIRRRAVRHQ